MMNHGEKDDVRPRGIEATHLLQSFGRAFELENGKTAVALRLKSQPRDSIDIFLSHVWATSPITRYIGLLWYNNSLISACTALIAVGLMSVMLAAFVDGRYWVWFESKFLLTVHSLTSLIGTAFLFISLFSVHILKKLLHFRESVYFMDRCCIEQEDHCVKLTEIRQIPYIIMKSKSMLILLSENYFRRLWCCYEMAVFVSSHKGRKVQLPILLPLRLVMITLLLVLVDLIYVVLIRSNLRTVGQLEGQISTRLILFRILTCFYSVVVAGLCLYFATAWNKENMKHTQVLRTFSLSDVECSDLADKDVLVDDIAFRFGSVEIFEKFVRNDMLNLVIKMNTPRIHLLLFAGLPQLFSMFGYVNALSQRIGLFCMASFDKGFAPRDDSFCVVLDREVWANAIIMVSQLVRFVCFYPVVFRLLVKGCEFIMTRFDKSRIHKILSYGAILLLTSAYITASNWKFPEEQGVIIQSVDACILLSIFCIFLLLPKLNSTRIDRLE